MTSYNHWGVTSFGLVLPRLQTSESIHLASITPSASNLTLSVSESFSQVWINGPASGLDDDIFTAITELAIGFCQMIQDARGKAHVYEKTSATDLVTDMDTGIEMMIRIWLTRFCPTHKVIGEEGFKPTIYHGNTVWYIDPIDGTYNYVSGGDHVGINIACVRNGQPQYAFVGLPFKQTAYTGRASTPGIQYRLNTALWTPFQPPATPADCIIGTEYFRSNQTEIDYIQTITHLLSATVVSVKSITANMAWLIEGQTLAFYKRNVKLWDIMAPLGLLVFAKSSAIRFGIYFTPREPAILCSPFDETPDWLSWINTRHQDGGRVGYFLICPSATPHIWNTLTEQAGFS